MSKTDIDLEFFSLNQVTISLLLLAMVIMRETIDNEIIQAVCLACILSLVIKEVDSQRTKNLNSEYSVDWDTSDSNEEHPSADLSSTKSPLGMEENPPWQNIPDHHFHDESEALIGSAGPSSKTASDMANRRPVEVFNATSNGTLNSHHQSVTWKQMPPKSIVPTRRTTKTESQNLSIRFVP